MSKLQAIIQKLNLDPMFAITVEYRDQFNNWVDIVRNATANQLIQSNGSIADFFEQLYAKNMTTVRITPKKQNGSNAGKPNFKSAPGMEIFEMTFQPKEPKSDLVQTKPTVLEAVPIPSNSFGLMAGMNMPEVYYKTQDHGRLTSENATLREKVERLESEKAELKETVMMNKYSSDKSSANADLLKVIVPLLAPMITKSFTPAADLGLGQPVENLSAVQSAFMSFVRQADDQFLQDLYKVVNGMENDEFDKELDELLIKHNLKQPLQDAV